MSNAPGSKLLMVTLCLAIDGLRDKPATNPLRPLRAPLDKPKISIGALTALDVMLTMRPKPRDAMPSMVAFISSMGVNMFASTALIQASRSHSRKSPLGGPPALVTTMSKFLPGPPATDQMAARPASVVMSCATGNTVTPCWRKPAAEASRTAAPRETITRFTPACASALAQPQPKPLLAPPTSAHLPLMPKSMFSLLIVKPYTHR